MPMRNIKINAAKCATVTYDCRELSPHTSGMYWEFSGGFSYLGQSVDGDKVNVHHPQNDTYY